MANAETSCAYTIVLMRNSKVQSSSPLKSFSPLLNQCFPVLNGLPKENEGTKKGKEKKSRKSQKIAQKPQPHKPNSKKNQTQNPNLE